jgi:hypothetical protein
VHSSNTGTCHKSDNGLGNHREVDSNGITLADTHLLEHPGCPRDLPKELAICDISALAGFIGLINDGNTIGIFESMAVYTVVRGVQAAFVEV